VLGREEGPVVSTYVDTNEIGERSVRAALKDGGSWRGQYACKRPSAHVEWREEDGGGKRGQKESKPVRVKN